VHAAVPCAPEAQRPILLPGPSQCGWAYRLPLAQILSDISGSAGARLVSGPLITVPARSLDIGFLGLAAIRFTYMSVDLPLPREVQIFYTS
jgi:hypothetical protein